MNFLPRDICEKLVEIGCRSESGYQYFTTHRGDHILDKDYINFPIDEDVKNGPSAFIFQDFCGISEGANKNLELLQGIKKLKKNDDNILLYETILAHLFQLKYLMLEKTWDEWVEFMRKTLGL